MQLLAYADRINSEITGIVCSLKSPSKVTLSSNKVKFTIKEKLEKIPEEDTEDAEKAVQHRAG